MSVLGLDTATPATAVAVLRDDGTADEARHDPGPGERPQHAQRLLGLVAEVLGPDGWEGVSRIAVGVGPGTFTGLRIGIATARALAQGRGLGLAGVGTLRALAAGARPGPVLAVLDARRGEAFVAGYDAAGNEVLAPAAVAPERLAEAVRAVGPGARAVGDGAVRFRERLQAAGAAVAADDSASHAVSARQVCLLGAAQPERPLAAILPDYRRVPDAELTRRRRQAP